MCGFVTNRCVAQRGRKELDLVPRRGPLPYPEELPIQAETASYAVIRPYLAAPSSVTSAIWNVRHVLRMPNHLAPILISFSRGVVNDQLLYGPRLCPELVGLAAKSPSGH